MAYKTRILIGVLIALASIGLLIIGFILENLPLLIISILLLMVSVILTILIMSLQVFIMDKELDIEALKKQGLTIVECPNCSKRNVLEDQYCIFCGEKLGENNEIIQE